MSDRFNCTLFSTQSSKTFLSPFYRQSTLIILQSIILQLIILQLIISYSIAYYLITSYLIILPVYDSRV